MMKQVAHLRRVHPSLKHVRARFVLQCVGESGFDVFCEEFRCREKDEAAAAAKLFVATKMDLMDDVSFGVLLDRRDWTTLAVYEVKDGGLLARDCWRSTFRFQEDAAVHWMRKIDVSDLWEAVGNDEATPQQFMERLSLELLALRPFSESQVERERLALIADVQQAARDEFLDLDDADEMMQRVWDWGDTPMGDGRKVCWIQTF